MKKLIFVLCLLMALPLGAQTYRMLVGTYTRNTESKGIYVLEIDVKKKTHRILDIAEGIANPSFLALSVDRQMLYSVSENSPETYVSAFRFDAGQGKLSFVNKSRVDGAGACHIAVTARHAVVANYGSGSLNVFGIAPDGSLTQVQQVIQHVGSSVVKSRQSEPHVHQVVISKDGQTVFVNDLGTDYVYAYNYNAAATDKVLTLVDTLLIEPGAGPRHLTLDADGKTLYVLHELNAKVSVLEYANQQFSKKQTVSMLDEERGVAGAADIHLSPDGRHLYASNRGDYNEISTFSVSRKKELKLIGQISSGGIAPRNFMITADGKYLFAGNQRSNLIVVFKRCLLTGKIKKTAFQIELPSPVCHIEF